MENPNEEPRNGPIYPRTTQHKKEVESPRAEHANRRLDSSNGSVYLFDRDYSGTIRGAGRLAVKKPPCGGRLPNRLWRLVLFMREYPTRWLKTRYQVLRLDQNRPAEEWCH